MLYAGSSAEEFLPPGFPRDVQANEWRHYDEVVNCLGEQLGRLLTTLREAKLTGRTNSRSGSH